MNLEEKLEKIERQLDEISNSRVPYPVSHIPNSASDEIDLRQLWNVLWNGKWMIVGVTLLFAVVSVIYALSLPNIYKSEALLAPAEENSGGGLSRIAGKLGGIASLAGVSFGGGEADKTTIAIEVLKSRDFIAKFVQKHDLLVPLMAAKNWDRNLDRLVIDKDLYDEASRKWVRESDPPRASEPSMQEAYEEFMRILSVSNNKETGLLTIGISHYSPSNAKEWVDFLVRDINNEVKQRDVLEAGKSIQYLSEQLEKTAIRDMKAVFYELIEEQTKTVMFAEVREEYVFKTIDPAIVPEVKSKPNKPLICILGVIFGGGFGSLIVLIRSFVSK